MRNHTLAQHFANPLATAEAALAAVRQQIADTQMDIAIGKLALDSLLDRFAAAGGDDAA